MQRILTIFAVLIFLCGSTSLYLYLNAPQIIESNIKTTLASAGFSHITLPAPQKTMGRISYSNIALDKDRFSTIKTLTINYSPRSMLFGSTVASIIIDRLELTGEMDAAGKISIAGWQTAEAAPPFFAEEGYAGVLQFYRACFE